VRGLAAFAREHAVDVPMLDRLPASNVAHQAFLTKRVAERAPKGGRILQIGLTYKPGTDDLRESPLIELATALIEAGYDLRLYDPEVDPASAALGDTGAGPSSLMDLLVTDAKAAVAAADLVVLAKPVPGILDHIPQAKPLIRLDRL
jgi:GDP-mannose 6-dehydrogenase